MSKGTLMLDARRLNIYVVVAEEGSFTAAAEKLYLSQPAVSQQMAILEREVGVPLMKRMPRGIALTPAGEVLAQRARVILDSMTELESELARLVKAPRRVRLGAFSTAGAHFIPLVVKAYREQNEGASLAVMSANAAEVPGQLRDGMIDIGLVWDYDFAPRPPEEGLRVTPLLTDPMRVVVPTDHPFADRNEVALSELADEPWIVRMHRRPYREAFETVCRIAGFEPHVVFRTEDYQAIQGLVAAGVGVSLVPALLLAVERPDIVTLPLAPPTFARRVSALTLPRAERDPAVARLLGLLREVAESVATR
jgi:DNA-binding transcriptional LysR family regulator